MVGLTDDPPITSDIEVGDRVELLASKVPGRPPVLGTVVEIVTTALDPPVVSVMWDWNDRFMSRSTEWERPMRARFVQKILPEPPTSGDLT